ncbi:hypothetical protein RI129_013142 [Pyrocoelia pectoralis]|uniref:Uncharacterized protein n=1 Tax=Pyrocoelia pectoralis TaxID=417401 RepID=A0AAN7UZV5_9COLE
MNKDSSVVMFLKALYYDDFKWSVVKSIGIFSLGVRLAQECAGMELLPGQ